MGVRQGCILSPVLLTTHVDGVVNEVEEEGVEISRNLKIHHVCCADDTVFLAGSEEDLNRYLNKLSNIDIPYYIEINKKNTKSKYILNRRNDSIMQSNQLLVQVIKEQGKHK